jgi:hypothetical protein
LATAKANVRFTSESGHVRYSKKLPDAKAGITLLSSVQAIRIIAMGRALVIGGSLGGLFAGLLLRQSGWDVAVFERSSGDLASRGVGIGTHVEQFEIMRRLGITVDERIGVAVTSRICLDRDGAVIARLPFEKTLTSWALFYRALRRRLPDACYRPGMQLEDVAQDASCVTALFANGIKVEGDLLVGADGAHSTVRSRVFGGPAPSYAGYVAWRGVVDEDAVAAAGCGDLIDTYAFFPTPREMVLSYWQPGADDDFRSGRRRLNWIWYHPVRSAELETLCTDASGRRHNGGIPPPLIRPEVMAAFRTEACGSGAAVHCANGSDACPVFPTDLRSGLAADRDWPCCAAGRCRLRCATACRCRRHKGRLECRLVDRCARGDAGRH